MIRPLILLVLVISSAVSRSEASSSNGRGQRQQQRTGRQQNQQPQLDKLLVVVIDGFRWDYLTKFTKRAKRTFSGFNEFRMDGVSTEYLKSVFPSESFPTWQTINTGLYPGSHGIIADTFYDPDENADIRKNPERPKFFNPADSRTTKRLKWWAKADPIWYTGAQQQGLKFSTFLWGRCDVAIYNQKKYSPLFCENVFEKDDSKTLKVQMEMALIHFQQGTDAAFVYEDSLGKVAQEFGPLSTNVEKRLRQIDDDIRFFLNRLRESRMDRHVNVVIMSDHGMAYGSDPIAGTHPINSKVISDENNSVQKVSIGKALQNVQRNISMVVGSGAYSMIYPKLDSMAPFIAQDLRQNLPDDGSIMVYTKDEIPDELNWRQNPYCPPILVLAKTGTVLLRAGPRLQRPMPVSTRQMEFDTSRVLEMTQQGISGYDPDEEDMRGVFMARGPGFKSEGLTYDSIELVDVYQIFCHLLGIEPESNDGVWSRVVALLKNSSPRVAPSLVASVATSIAASLLISIMCTAHTAAL